MSRSVLSLSLVGFLTVAGCSTNPAADYSVRDSNGNVVATAKSVPSGTTIEDCVDPVGEFMGEAYCPDPDSDNAYAVNSADPFNGAAPTCLCISAGDPGVGWNSVTTTSQITVYDCGPNDPAIADDYTTAYVDSDNDGVGTGASSMQCGVGTGTGFAGVDGDCDDGDDSVGAPSVEAYGDVDGDGYGAGAVALVCEITSGWSDNDGDCDDGSAAVNPAMVETCNGIDDNCDIDIDNDAMDADTWYADEDGDNFGDSSNSVAACEAPSGFISDWSDCNDGDANTFPGAAASDSLSACQTDADWDGYGDDNPAEGVTPGTDCNDGDDGINPGATDVPADGFDQDCYGGDAADPDPDSDGDGETDSTDCNDTNPAVYSGAMETCNSVDDDCDGSVDDGVMSTFYGDTDGDGYGNAASTASACSASAGWVANSTDCNDSSATVYPAAPETCNSADDDCDGMVDDGLATGTYYLDADGDAYGTSTSSIVACSMPGGYSATSTDCNDASSAVNPGVSEVSFNGIDDNCDGAANTTASATITVTPNTDQAGVPWELWLRNKTADPSGSSTTTWAAGGAASGTGPLTGTVTVTNGTEEALNGPMMSYLYWAAQTTGTNVSMTFSVNGYSRTATNTCWDGTAWNRVGCPGTDLIWSVNTQ